MMSRFLSAQGEVWRLGYHFCSPGKGVELGVEVAGAQGEGMVFVL
jgi:hypothetical protein